MSRESDLRAVFNAFPLTGLLNLHAAQTRGRLFRGSYVKNEGGCLLNLLSQGEIDSRSALKDFCLNEPLADEAATRRVIAAWDHGQAISKTPGYAKFYPDPGYTLSDQDIRTALRAAIVMRLRVNRAENQTIAKLQSCLRAEETAQ